MSLCKVILFSQLLNTNLFLNYLNEEPFKSMFSKDVLEYENKIGDLESAAFRKDENK